MDFGKALQSIKAGNRVARAGWNGKGMWLRYVPGGVVERDGETRPALPYVEMSTVGGELVPWLASQTDLLAEDWIELRS